ncbi:hypothetical protein V8G54_036221, partial [Vigna mungo]
RENWNPRESVTSSHPPNPREKDIPPTHPLLSECCCLRIYPPTVPFSCLFLEHHGSLSAGVPLWTSTHPPIFLPPSHGEVLVLVRLSSLKATLYAPNFRCFGNNVLGYHHRRIGGPTDILNNIILLLDFVCCRFDYGVIVLKIMELWDGIEKYDGNTMPSYTIEELQQVREKYVCDWILDVNVRRAEVLQDLDVV